MAVLWSFLTSCFPCLLLAYFLNDFETVPVAPIIMGITIVFTFNMRFISIVRSLYFRIFSSSFLITFLSPGIGSVNIIIIIIISDVRGGDRGGVVCCSGILLLFISNFLVFLIFKIKFPFRKPNVHITGHWSYSSKNSYPHHYMLTLLPESRFESRTPGGTDAGIQQQKKDGFLSPLGRNSGHMR